MNLDISRFRANSDTRNFNGLRIRTTRLRRRMWDSRDPNTFPSDGRPRMYVMYLVPDDNPPESTSSLEDSTPPAKNPAKVTARMLKLRELISTGDYPDRDELAERIVDKL